MGTVVIKVNMVIKATGLVKSSGRAGRDEVWSLVTLVCGGAAREGAGEPGEPGDSGILEAR